MQVMKLLNKRYKPFSLIIGLILCFQFQNKAQPNDELVSSYIKNLSDIWVEMNPRTFDAFILDSSLTLIADPFKLVPTSNKDLRKEMLLRSNILQQSINKKDLGFHFTVNYQENFKSPIADPEEIVIFKRRAIAGLDWDILKNGFYDNKVKNKVLKVDYDLIQRKKYSDNLNKFQSIQTEQLIRYFNEKKIAILNTRDSLNLLQTSIIEKLWSIKHITKDNYLKAIQNTTDISAQYNLYRNYNQAEIANKQKFEFELPLLDINLASLLQKSNIESIDSNLAYYQQNAKYKSSYINDISLKAYTRYNYYDVYNSNQPNRTYVSVGMNLSVPLAFNQKDKKELYVIQSQLANYKAEVSQQDFQANLLNHYYEYQYKLKQFKNLYHKRLVYLELIRTERAKYLLTDLEFNPNTALFILDDFWSNSIELLDLKQDLYKILLSLKTKLPDVNISEYTNPLSLNNLSIASSNPPFKAVYIWSDAFKNHSENVINEYCKVNEFNKLLISYNTTKVYLQNIKQFISKNYTSSIHLMIGSNKLLNNGIVGYLDTLKQSINLKQIKGIHLDIEPHTQPNFKENQVELFIQYIKILKQAKQFAIDNKLELSVSIPLSYPENILQEINKVCDNVYLMVYENINEEFVNRKCAEEVAIFKDKCVFALRTKDFKDRNEMDLYFKKMKFKKTAYHDLDDLIKFDNSSINAKDLEEKK